MKRTTIFVPEALERDLQLYARKAGKPAAVVVREALTAYIAEKRQSNRLPSFAGAFDSGHSNTASRHDEILFGRLDPHDGPATLPKRRATRVRNSRSPRPRRR